MGSLVLSEVAHDTARFPDMIAGGAAAHQAEHDVTPSIYHPTHPPQTSNLSPNRDSSKDGQHKLASTTKSTASSAPYQQSSPTVARTDETTTQAQISSRPATSPIPPSQRSSTRHEAPQAFAHTASNSSSTSPIHKPAVPVSADHSPAMGSPPRVRVKDLRHIESFAGGDFDTYIERDKLGLDASSLNADSLQFEISDMPIADVIEMVAGLLTKITATNDQQAEHLHKRIPSADMTSALSKQASSVLSFHGKNVPAIGILSYLTRIHKYCPATYEVFLSLLVYFDRITGKVNSTPMHNLRRANEDSSEPSSPETENKKPRQSFTSSRNRDTPATTKTSPPATPSDPHKSHRTGQNTTSVGAPTSPTFQPTPSGPVPGESDPLTLAQFFVVDSFNIHRLVIAGVTCASKFFSDVFYTNSRYAKVGGLPLPELNNLELQFLLLNDFRLSIPVEELEQYATMLVEFYAREVVAQRVCESSSSDDDGEEVDQDDDDDESIDDGEAHGQHSDHSGPQMKSREKMTKRSSGASGMMVE
ncbi:MAG: hypothetical protein M1831_002471 [Alyxoria varia]|nr:MAG: hypothetical protein M1831_002471 [Alyxoria varia]